jgi:exosortase E/protease (VPEID-CTERM system)
MSPTRAETRLPWNLGLRGRLPLTALLLAGELLLVTIAVDTGSLSNTGGIAGFAGAWGPWGLRLLLLSTVLAFTFACGSARGVFKGPAPAAAVPLPVRASLHGAFFAAFGWSALRLVGPDAAGRDWAAIATACAGTATVISALLLLLPFAFWMRLFESARWAPAAAVGVAAGALGALQVSSALAAPWLRLTFECAHALLRVVTSPVIVNRRTMLLGTPAFQVNIAPACSGYEGVVLMLVFGTVWLWLFRRDFRFPRALLLVPAGMAAIWVLNCLRLVVLVLIGSAGAPEIAAGGFHSQAGWIAFLIAASAFALGSQRLAWIAARPQTARSAAREHPDETAAYLLPFLVILAAGMVAQAASSGFEWLYGLRVIAAAAALWWGRRSYARLCWRAGWQSAAIGAAVFALWLGVDRLLAPPAAMPMPAALAAAPAAARIGWLVLRAIGGVLTVPVAEELAFRGYLLRRFVAPDFARVDPRRFTWFSFALSSILFGAMHGRLWLPGIAAGALYAIAMRRRGRIGEAVAAHATTNALLAIWVLATGEWRLW